MKSEWSSYRRTNCVLGWLMFVVASFVYIATAEPTVSFWDCGEFILSAFKLQIGHPPGAPIFLMIDRLATMFAFGDVSKVALMANILSALCSGLTIMFLFWSITYLVKRTFIGKEEDPEGTHMYAIMGAGMLGALAYTFSDTFWFSAVEGELYAMSSLMTAIVFWAALKWDEESEDEHAGRWIVFIAFMMGLGLGVHRLSLLVLPIMVFVYYFNKFEFSWQGFFKACVLSVVLLGALVFVIIPGVPKVAGWFELLFVNVLGLPYNTGLMVFIVATIALLVWGIRYTVKNSKVILNYIITCLTVIMIGYSSYAVIVIRSSANPPMNQNMPSDIFSLSYYINMEQYGSAPKLFGQYYSAPRTNDKDVIAGYNKVDGKYEPYYRVKYEYDDKFMTIFPRMYSDSDGHPEAYQYWGKVKGRKYTVRSGSESETVVCPTFSENLRYFFRYQCGFMYWRYFMWNFAGRQNDIQGNGNPMYGNWISGINFIDDVRLGDQDDLPEDIKNNPGRNRYYCIPLILGILGLLWQYKKDNNGFIVVLTFFIMTGLAIIVFLNQYPNQPRERDYAYAGSFYAYAIWIGIGLMSVYDFVRKYLKNNKVVAAGVSVVLLLACPILMASENWNDHDRSDRYTAKAVGSNYLNSVDKDAILFSYGDNDSFPLWYSQEVEGIRTDVKVVNLSYFQAGWYIKVMRQQAYDAKPIPMSIENEKYRDGTRDQLLINTNNEQVVSLKDAVRFASQDEKKYMIEYSKGLYFNYLPSNKFSIDVDSAFVVSNGIVKDYYKDRIKSPMQWNYNLNYVLKGNLGVMDLLATNDWKRPIYFTSTVPTNQYMGLDEYFVQEGLSYKITPIQTDVTPGNVGMIDPYTMYDNMMNKFTWGNAELPNVYLDENNRRMFCNFRNTFGELGKALLVAGDTIKAVEVADKGMSIVPPEKMPYDYYMIGIAETYLRAGETEKGNALVGSIINYSKEYLNYLVGIDAKSKYGLDLPKGINMQTIIDIYRMSHNLGLEDLEMATEAIINDYYYLLFAQ